MPVFARRHDDSADQFTDEDLSKLRYDDNLSVEATDLIFLENPLVIELLDGQTRSYNLSPYQQIFILLKHPLSWYVYMVVSGICSLIVQRLFCSQFALWYSRAMLAIIVASIVVLIYSTEPSVRYART